MSDIERRQILKLQLAYLTALCLVALLAVGGHLAVERLAGSRGADGTIINLAGRQRMLSERLAKRALVLAAGRDVDRPVDAPVALGDVLSRLVESHRVLSRGDPALGVPAPVDAALVAGYAGIEAPLTTLRGSVARLLANPADGLALNALLSAQRDFVARQNALVDLHERIAVDKHAAERRLVTALFWVTLATLALEAMFVFEPAVRVMRRLVVRLTETNRRMTWQADHDALTGLPNRRALGAELDALCEPGSRIPFALLFLDFDGFKRINDSYGHEAGDTLLTGIAARLRALEPTSPDMRVAPHRLGGDEFVLLVHGATCTADAERLGDAVTAAFREAHAIDGRELVSTASVGIVLPSPGRRDPATLLRDADAAMMRAKRDGKSRHATFDHRMLEQASRSQRLQVDLCAAIDAGVPGLRYQAMAQGTDGRVTAVEALLHWHHPEFGEIDNLEALDVARDGGRLRDLGRLVLGRATRQWRELQREDGFAQLDLHVNLSLDELLHPECTADVAAALRGSGMPAARLHFECSGGLPERGLDAFEDAVRRLASLGVRIGFDNVGHQPMPLRAFTRLPVDFIKMVPSDAVAVLAPFARFCRSLGYRTIATGIETDAMLEVAKGARIDAFQGWRIGRPTGLREAALGHLAPESLTARAPPRPAPRAARAAGRAAPGAA